MNQQLSEDRITLEKDWDKKLNDYKRLLDENICTE